VLFVNLRRIEREGMESLLAARRLGLDVILLGRSLPGFAAPLVHEFRQVDTYDTDLAMAAALELATRYDISGVANFTEIDVQLVATIAGRLGLPGMPVEAALKARNKYHMKESLSHLDGILPRYRRVRSLEELRDAVVETGLPAVVKPTGASGSKGIFELHKPADLEPAIARLSEIAQPTFDPVFRQFGAEFIVEEYLDGDEVSVEGFVARGEVHIVMVTDKLTTLPYHLELEHTMPSVLPAGTLAEVHARTERVIAALGFDNCAFHLEVKCGSRGVRFIEVAARPAGDYIASHLLPLASGVDFFQNVIRVAMGDPLRLRPDRDLHVGLRFLLAEHAGRFEGLDGIEVLCTEPGYQHVFFEHPVGTQVSLPPDSFGLQRVAAICARHTDRAGLDALLARAVREVTARVSTTPVG
jgi:biotin carboxylase